MKLSILMPVFNEMATLQSAVQEVLTVDYPCDVELVIVDDGSTDGTRKLYDEFSDDARVSVYLHERNQGKGAAIRTAAQSATGEYLIMCDADLEYSPAEIPSLLASGAQRRCDRGLRHPDLRQPQRVLLSVRAGQPRSHHRGQHLVQLLHQRPRDLLQVGTRWLYR